MTKVDAGSFNAFSSPNLAPLANAEVDITSKQPKSWKTCSFLTPELFKIVFLRVVFSQLGHSVEGQHHSHVSSFHGAEQERGSAQAVSWDNLRHRKDLSS